MGICTTECLEINPACPVLLKEKLSMVSPELNVTLNTATFGLNDWANSLNEALETGNWDNYYQTTGPLALNAAIMNLLPDPQRPGSAAEGALAPEVAEGAPRPIPQGHQRVFRAVSEAEYQDMLRTGRFNRAPNGIDMEGRWFADTLEGAQAHGNALYPQGGFRIIEADVPTNAPSFFQRPNLDGRGPATYLHLDDLGNVTPRPAGS
jgi:hypothetical protein